LPVVLLVGVIVLVAAGCSSESSSFGQYFQGRTLHISVVSIERLPELRYSTIDPNEVIRRWSISPSEPGGELVLMRMKVENHTAVSAFINVDRSAAELRDFSNATFRPLSVAQTVWQDFRGEQEALVRMDLGQCFDGARALIDPGTTISWQSEAESSQFITFDDSSVPLGTDGVAELAPGQSLTHTFDQAGEFSYDCSSTEGNKWPAEVRVASEGSQTGVSERSVQFLEGSFELLQGHGLEGYLVFEAPEGTEFRDMRWRTGDSITVRF
jgi:plastocyanin